MRIGGLLAASTLWSSDCRQKNLGADADADADAAAAYDDADDDEDDDDEDDEDEDEFLIIVLLPFCANITSATINVTMPILSIDTVFVLCLDKTNLATYVMAGMVSSGWGCQHLFEIMTGSSFQIHFYRGPKVERKVFPG